MLILKFVSRPPPPPPQEKKTKRKKTIDNKPVRKETCHPISILKKDSTSFFI